MRVRATEIRVRRDAIGAASAHEVELEAGEGGALFAVDRFAVTANNATYAAHGDDMGYWRFYPAPEGFGIVPVWGFATCVASGADGVAAGERFYGYWPMASHARLRPTNAGPRGFADAAPHRAGLAAIYNSYLSVDGAAGEAIGDERAYALFRPLYTTSFLLDDRVAEVEGLTLVALSSASSKTALGLARALRERAGVEVVGLTSPANLGFVTRTGLYDRALAYGDAGGLRGARGPAAYVDFAGSGSVSAAVHEALGDALALSVVVGDTHWREPPARALPGPRPEFFFAPDRAAARMSDWGPAGFQSRLDAGWRAFLEAARGWLAYDEASGPEATAAAWAAAVEGRADPAVGVIRSLGA